MPMMEPATTETRRSVCEELNTTEDALQQNVDDIKDWLRAQPHLPQGCSSDTMLTTYLIACKNRIERAKQKIDNYYTARGSIPDIYASRAQINERLLEVNKEIRLFFLRKLSPDGCRVMFVSFATGDPKKYDVEAFARRWAEQEDVKMNVDAFDQGRYFVIDARRYTMYHVMRLTPKLLRLLVYISQEVLPIRIKSVVFFNAPPSLDIILNIIKPFTPGKLLKKIHVHTDGAEVLLKYFPKEMLPMDYGGDEGTSETLNDKWLDLLEENRKWLLTHGSQTSNEEKRIKKQEPTQKHTNTDEVKCCLRKLEID